MNREQKARVVAELTDCFGKANAAFLVKYQGATVYQLQSLRKLLRKLGARFKVAKVRLAGRAAAATGKGGLDQLPLRGQVGVVFANDEVSAAAKVLVDFAKENEAIVVKAGFFESKLLDDQGVRALAALPSRLELLAMVASALNGSIAGLARALKAVADKKSEGAQ
jgi:large subunit ribosomal protein L10